MSLSALSSSVMEAHIHAKFENAVLPVSSYSTSSIVTDSYSLSIASLALLMVHIYFQALFARLGGNMSGLTYVEGPVPLSMMFKELVNLLRNFTFQR